MKEGIRTAIYAGIAVVFVTAAALVAHFTKPETPEAYSKTGQPFHEEFDPDIVARLELSAIPAGETDVQRFQLAKTRGLWRLQSYHGYPAEAEDRLAKTVASVLGIVRESLVGKSKKDHAKFGVVNPDDDELDDPDAAGKRIRMLDAEGNVLVDLILGNRKRDKRPVAKTGNENGLDETQALYYVRRADEDETYLARVENIVTTKFSKWIEPDLLKLEPGNVRVLKLDNYQTKEEQFMTPNGPAAQITPVNREKLTVSRDSEFGAWSLPNLDGKIESLKTAKIDELLRVLDEMTILGVVPRYSVEGESPLTGDLKFEAPKSSRNDPNARFSVLRSVVKEMSERGFSLQLTRENLENILNSDKPVPLQMLSENGDITVATKEGVGYHLHFGKQVVGSEKEIQFGGKPKINKPAAGGGKAKKRNLKNKEMSVLKDGGTNSDDTTTRRYVMIRVEFDASYRNDKPTRPTKPDRPSRPAIPAPKPRDREKPVVAPKPMPRIGRRRPVAAVPPDPVKRFYAVFKDYQEKQRQYERDLATYDSDLKTYDENVKKAEERVRRLNERFSGWFYVISTQNLKQLTLRRSDLVGPKFANGISP